MEDWYLCISNAKVGQWEECGIAHCLNLSLGNPVVNSSLLSVVCYFLSDALNAFVFGHGLMTLTLLDAFLLTDLDVTSSTNPGDIQIVPHHKILSSHQLSVNSLRTFLAEHKKIGLVNDREHTAFLMSWLDYIVFYSSSLGPSTDMQTIAERLVQETPYPLVNT
jgi:hypothetical protein